MYKITDTIIPKVQYNITLDQIVKQVFNFLVYLLFIINIFMLKSITYRPRVSNRFVFWKIDTTHLAFYQ